ncbi:MAG: dimethyl sulfoxide reductase anchor subunit [Rhizobiaceae bacterium]|nr:dimethyl sulfoxide reductase anchor subunit [Rhizobiaceae bacterium]
MHPAYSVIFFTTATGAGYGLLACLGIFAFLGFIEAGFWFRLVSLGIAVALISAGLLSSTAHLGRPERAWRAFSQWKSSWLSREGVAAVATFIPTAAFGLGWVLLGLDGGWTAAAGLLSAIGAAVTVSTTGMIYASLKPIAQWSSRYTLPAYLIFAVMTGCVLFNALLSSFGQPFLWVQTTSLLLTGCGWAWKRATWRHNDGQVTGTTLNSATGLMGGEVRSIEWPHTEENYVLKEMGFIVARKHAAKLRLIAQALTFAMPFLLLALSVLLREVGWLAALFAMAATILQLAGMLVERWLFFAEARHTVALYYGR